MDDSDGSHPVSAAAGDEPDGDDAGRPAEQEERDSGHTGGEPSTSSPADDEAEPAGEDGWHPV
ncbi:hypothetical protein [Phytoactinopolyspora halotolerans]|uniref:Uncharacterized protein n=1 Tax=Phytoactinopolyspora halotolerans TaxID=1981512 RepID=A0A6L9SFV8_9ACTN|nr:hypothetical protein [Phytoactinopolyspora halotolerans]NEE03528.1 hypothetical protein [Phytoactinopolyspora halotolerans]